MYRACAIGRLSEVDVRKEHVEIASDETDFESWNVGGKLGTDEHIVQFFGTLIVLKHLGGSEGIGAGFCRGGLLLSFCRSGVLAFCRAVAPWLLLSIEFSRRLPIEFSRRLGLLLIDDCWEFLCVPPRCFHATTPKLSAQAYCEYDGGSAKPRR